MTSVGVMKVGVGDPRHDELDAQEEADVAKPLLTPDMLTRSELLDHCVTHTPYRCWCRHCVEGYGREFGHRSRTRGPHEVTTVSFDYAFIGGKGEIVSKE